jgi:hypothetical protein
MHKVHFLAIRDPGYQVRFSLKFWARNIRAIAVGHCSCQFVCSTLHQFSEHCSSGKVYTVRHYLWGRCFNMMELQHTMGKFGGWWSVYFLLQLQRVHELITWWPVSSEGDMHVETQTSHHMGCVLRYFKLIFKKETLRWGFLGEDPFTLWRDLKERNGRASDYAALMSVSRQAT